MRTKLMQLGSAAAIAALVASPSFAQNSTSPSNSANPSGTSSSSTPPSTPAPAANTAADANTNANTATNDAGKRDEVRASKLVGSTVYNDQNQSVGTLDDILVSHDSKQPDRAVISVGGFLGIGSKLVEVPYDRLKLEANNKVVMPDASSDQLKGMQSFSYNTLEHSGTTNASGNTNEHYGSNNTGATATSSSAGMGAPTHAGGVTGGGSTTDAGRTSGATAK